MLLLLFASFITWHKDVRNKADWYGKYNNKNSFIVATIAEPLQQKPKSFKAIANADALIVNEISKKTKGKFLIYFSKDSVQKI